MKVGIVSSWPRDLVRGSGTARFLLDLEEALRSAGAEVSPIGADLDLSDYPRFVAARLDWNRALPRDPRARSVNLILGVDFDGFALPSGRDGYPPKVVTPQGLFAEIAPTEPEPFRSLLLEQAEAERANLEDAAFAIVPSAYAAGAAVRHYGVSAERIEVIPHGFDLDGWERLLAAGGPPDDDRERPIILSVARLYPRKGIDVLLRGFAILARTTPEARLRIVGDGIEAERLRRLAIDLRLEIGVQVRFDGEIRTRAELARSFAHASLFCLPSRQESFGFVFLEAMAAGLPVVAARAGAAPEVIGEAGVIVPPDDPDAIAAALEALLLDPEKRRELGRAGRERVRRYRWDRAAAAYLHRFRQVCDPG